MISQFELEISGIDLSESTLGQKRELSKKLLVESSQFFLNSYFENKLKENQLFSCHLKIVDSQEIQQLNKDFRGKDKPTDVLSFPIFEDLRNNPKDLESFMRLELGDIFICWDILLQQAKEFELQPWEELLHLYIHGFLHLAGFDHDLGPSEQKLMEDWEKETLLFSSSILSR